MSDDRHAPPPRCSSDRGEQKPLPRCSSDRGKQKALPRCSSDRGKGGTDELIAPFDGSEHYAHIALAVSGGADSVAMMCLARDWLGRLAEDAPHPQFTVLTVDHALREAAAAEAEWVKSQAARLGFPHHTLVWQGAKPATGIQAAARHARYGLLSAHCHAHGIDALAVAHTRDDQAETVLMRLARGSGADGLSGMAPVSHMNGLAVLRPLLGVARDRLEAYLRGNGQDWIEDPSNQDAHYERVRIRRAMRGAGADALGLTPEALALTARRLRRTRDAAEFAASAFLATALQVHDAGYGEMPLADLLDAPEDVALRALARAAAAFGGGVAHQRLARLEALYDALRGGAGSVTLAGCAFLVRRGRLLIAREYGRMDKNAIAIALTAAAQTLAWDGRFAVTLPPDAPSGLTLRPLGPDGLAAMKAANGSLSGIPRAAALALPSLWHDDALRYTPCANWRGGEPAGWLAECRAKCVFAAELFAQR